MGPELGLEEGEARRTAQGREQAEPLWNFVLYCRRQEGMGKVPGGRITEQIKEQIEARQPWGCRGVFYFGLLLCFETGSCISQSGLELTV